MGIIRFCVVAKNRLTECRRRDKRMKALKVPGTKKGSWERELPPTASELEALPIPHKESGNIKCGGKRMVVNGSGLDIIKMANPVARDVFQGTARNVNQERLHVLKCIDLREFLDEKVPEHFQRLVMIFAIKSRN